MNIQQVYYHLECHHIHPSVQRVAIMQYMLEHECAHPTVEQIYADLLPSMPTLSKATVYNTLKLFVEKKAIMAHFMDERTVRYDLNKDLHAHFKCRHCDDIHDVPLEKSDVPHFMDSGNLGLSPDEMQIYFLGTCKKCNGENGSVS